MADNPLSDLVKGSQKVASTNPLTDLRDFAARAKGMSHQDMVQEWRRLPIDDPFGKYLRNRIEQPQEGESEADTFRRLYGEIPRPAPKNWWQGMVRAGAQGATVGHGDELTALLEGLGVGDFLRGTNYTEGRSFDEVYDTRLAQERQKLESFRETDPVAAIGGEIAGAGPMMIAGPLMSGGRLVPLAEGLLLGGAYGFGAGEGGLAERAISAGKGAGLGLLAGAGGTGIGMLARKFAKPTQAVRQAIGEGVDEAGKRITQTLDDVLGKPQGIRETSRAISQSTAPQRQAAYNRAYAEIIDYASPKGQVIEDVLGRIDDDILKAASKRANARMRADFGRDNFKQILLNVADDGSVTFKEMPNVRQIDYIKRALNKIADEGTDAVTGRMSDEGSLAASLATRLRDATADAVKPYGTALRVGADKAGQDAGLQLGRKFFQPGTTREMVSEFVKRNPSDEALNAAKLAVRQQLDDMLARVRRTATDPNVDAREAERALSLLSSRDVRSKMATLLGEDDAARLFQAIDGMGPVYDARKAVRGASTPEKVNPAPIAENVVDLVATGTQRPVATARQVANATRRGAPSRSAERRALATIDETLGVNRAAGLPAELPPDRIGRLTRELIMRGAIPGIFASDRRQSDEP